MVNVDKDKEAPAPNRYYRQSFDFPNRGELSRIQPAANSKLGSGRALSMQAGIDVSAFCQIRARTPDVL